MSPEKRSALAKLGGQASQRTGKAHRFTPEQAKAAGHVGGAKTASIPGHMSRMGALGGGSVSRDRKHMSKLGRLSGKVRQPQPDTTPEKNDDDPQ